MRVYADSSFLVSCYLPDANTPQAKTYLDGHDLPLAFTALHDLEVRNALRLGVFRGVLQNRHSR
jgi:predicted nucleic acid-binding protein